MRDCGTPFLIRIFLASSRKSSGRFGVVGSSLFRAKKTFAPSSRNRGANNRATRRVRSPSWTGNLLPTWNQRSSIFAHFPPRCPGSSAIFKPRRGFPGLAGGNDFADRQSRGTDLRPSSFSANRSQKNFCVSRFIRIRAVFSLISIKSGANP